MVVAVNTVLTMIMRRLVIYEKHPFITDMFSSLTTKIFIAKFLNTAIVVVIVNATLETYNVNIESPHFPLLAGAYNDFNMRWYFYVGAPIIMTVCMNSVTELSMPFALKAYQYYKIYKDRNKSGNKTISKKETQHDYDKMFIGGNFLLADQYASCLNTIFVVFLYSGGMPVLIFITCLIFYLKYKIEKWAFLRFYKRHRHMMNQLLKMHKVGYHTQAFYIYYLQLGCLQILKFLVQVIQHHLARWQMHSLVSLVQERIHKQILLKPRLPVDHSYLIVLLLAPHLVVLALH